MSHWCFVQAKDTGTDAELRVKITPIRGGKVSFVLSLSDVLKEIQINQIQLLLSLLPIQLKLSVLFGPEKIK